MGGAVARRPGDPARRHPRPAARDPAAMADELRRRRDSWGSATSLSARRSPTRSRRSRSCSPVPERESPVRPGRVLRFDRPGALSRCGTRPVGTGELAHPAAPADGLAAGATGRPGQADHVRNNRDATRAARRHRAVSGRASLPPVRGTGGAGLDVRTVWEGLCVTDRGVTARHRKSATTRPRRLAGALGSGGVALLLLVAALLVGPGAALAQARRSRPRPGSRGR